MIEVDAHYFPLRKRWVCGGWIGSGIVGGMVGRSSLYFWIKVLIAGCLLSLRWPGVSGETNDESDLELYEEYRIEGPIDVSANFIIACLQSRLFDTFIIYNHLTTFCTLIDSQESCGPLPERACERSRELQSLGFIPSDAFCSIVS